MKNTQIILVLFLSLIVNSLVFAQDKSTEWKMLMYKAMQHYHADNYEKAESLAEKAFILAEENFEADSDKMSSSINNLALIYKKQGKYSNAETLYKEALEINIKTFGENNSNTAQVLHNLGQLYLNQGKIDKAEKTLKASLAIKEKIFEKNDSSIAITINSLAVLYDEGHKNYVKAEKYYKQSIEIFRESVKSNSSDQLSKRYLLRTLSSLKEFYIATDQFEKAAYIDDKLDKFQ